MNSPQSAKLAYAAALASLAALPAQLWPTALRNIYHPDVAWHGPHPINAHNSARDVITNFWQPTTEKALQHLGNIAHKR